MIMVMMMMMSIRGLVDYCVRGFYNVHRTCSELPEADENLHSQGLLGLQNSRSSQAAADLLEFLRPAISYSETASEFYSGCPAVEHRQI